MRFKKSQILAAATLLAVALAGLLAPWVAPYDPLEQPSGGRHLPPLTAREAVRQPYGWELAERVERTPEGIVVERSGRTVERRAEDVLNLTPDGVADRRFFLMGSDRLGRDVFSRFVYGARVSLLIGLGSVLLAEAIGIAAGAFAALGPRAVDSVMMRIVDGMLALPWLVLLIVLVAFFPRGDVGLLIVLIGATFWMSVARLVRGELLSLQQRGFVLAAYGLGAGKWHVFWRHLLPNALPPILVDATLRIAAVILLESSLSFLGFGVQPPHPSWGNMIAEARPNMTTAWWEGLFPGIGIVVTVVALAVVADAVRDRLDPRFEDR